MSIQKGKIEILDKLIDQWCESKELRPLSFVLPAYLGYNDEEQDKNKLISALSYLSAVRCLNPQEQKEIEDLISDLAGK